MEVVVVVVTMASQVQTENRKKTLEMRDRAFGPCLKCSLGNSSDQASKAIKQAKRSIGFTLIELLVAIAIIGMLAGVLLPNFMGARERARDTQRKQDLNQAKKALRLYYNDFQEYPTNDASGNILGCGADGNIGCAWGSEFSAGSGPTVYMKQLPTDPLGTGKYSYEKVSDDNFRLYATLENASDPDIEPSHARCGPGAETQYVVCAD